MVYLETNIYSDNGIFVSVCYSIFMICLYSMYGIFVNFTMVYLYINSSIFVKYSIVYLYIDAVYL